MSGIITFSMVDVMALKLVSIRSPASVAGHNLHPISQVFGSLETAAQRLRGAISAGRSVLRLCKGSQPSLNAPRGGARVARDEKNATSRIFGLHLSFDVDHRRC